MESLKLSPFSSYRYDHVNSSGILFRPYHGKISHIDNEPRPPLCGHLSLLRQEHLNEEQLTIKERILRYIEGGDEEILEPDERKVIELIESKIEIEIDDIRKFTDSRKLLETVKIIDLAFIEYNKKTRNKKCINTYNARTKILEAYPVFSTNEIYTRTLDPKKLKNREFLRDPKNWISERVGHQAKIIINQYIKTKALSHRLVTSSSHWFIIRAPTGGGKSHFIRKMFQSMLEENEANSGILNPDEIKFSLKKLSPHPVNIQVHPEGSMLFKNFIMAIINKPWNLIMEGRYSNIEEIQEMVQHARQRLRRIFLVDIAHASLSLLLKRILARDPYGQDPCPFSLDIVKGYIESIASRKKLLEIVRINPNIEYFNLYFFDEQENCHLIAQKEEQRFKILSKELLEKSYSVPSNEHIERQLNEVIDRNRFPHYEKWEGLRIQKAIDQNATINCTPKTHIDESKWGKILLEPFDGLWLSDYPNLKEHIESEHILHIRQSDADGIGLHWPKNKFPEGPNPKFSQDARIDNSEKRGFQMKLGYFLIHPSLIENHLASPSTEIYEEMIDKKTGCFRFFVHPEAYDNFSLLHSCHQAKFVIPNDSEFIGTPTSSYRSWLIRNVSTSKRAVPFIVKLGVGSARNRGKLLPREDIVKSIDVQKNINNFKSRHNFFYFPETIGIILKRGFSEEDSGLIIREIPPILLRGECHIFSFSALMSVERVKKENHGICALLSKSFGLDKYPLIFEIFENAKQKEQVHTVFEFINKYFITNYFNATKTFYFNHGYSFSPHGQNLCLVLRNDGIPLGFAYRDFEGVSEGGKGYIESYSWFYRYHCMVKLLNVMTHNCKKYFNPPQGAPTQLGYSEPLQERNLYPFINGFSQHKIFFTYDDYKNVLDNLDNMFLNNLSRYFNIENMHELKIGTIPSSEGGSVREAALALLNKMLWENRVPKIPITSKERGNSKIAVHKENKDSLETLKSTSSEIQLQDMESELLQIRRILQENRLSDLKTSVQRNAPTSTIRETNLSNMKMELIDIQNQLQKKSSITLT